MNPPGGPPAPPLLPFPPPNVAPPPPPLPHLKQEHHQPTPQPHVYHQQHHYPPHQSYHHHPYTPHYYSPYSAPPPAAPSPALTLPPGAPQPPPINPFSFPPPPIASGSQPPAPSPAPPVKKEESYRSRYDDYPSRRSSSSSSSYYDRERERDRDRVRDKDRDRERDLHRRERDRDRDRHGRRGDRYSHDRERDRYYDEPHHRSRHSRRDSPPRPSSSSSRRSRSPLRDRPRGGSQRAETPTTRAPVRKKAYYTDAFLDKQKEFLEKRADMKAHQIIEQEKKIWTRSAPADLYYERDAQNPLLIKSTEKLRQLCDKFEEEVVDNGAKGRARYPAYEPPRIKRALRRCTGHSCEGSNCNDGDDSSDDSSDDEDERKQKKKDTARDESMEWLQHRQRQPTRLHEELWDNRTGEVNDGPACKCSVKSKRTGIRHGIYHGEKPVTGLEPETNNSTVLHHYKITISPPTNFLIKVPTVIHHDEHDFIFEGFSLFTTEPLKDLPVCSVLRFNIRYQILYFKEKVPDNFTLRELKIFHKYFFKELLELVDWEINDRFYFMPRFVRDLSENGKEILSMNEVVKYLLSSYKPLIEDYDLGAKLNLPESEWLDFTDEIKGMIVTSPGMSPAAVRVDQLDREQDSHDVLKYPDIVHNGTRPPQLCYAGNAEYQRAHKEYVKFRHLMANMQKPRYNDRRALENLEMKLQEMRSNTKMKREVTVAVSSQGFFRTGLMADIVQHGMLLPVLVNHLRLHASLDYFEDKIQYKFKNRHLLQLAMTHPSYKENYGTTPDHGRNTLSNCGIRQPEYGDKKVHQVSHRKRGINMLISIMSKFGRKVETESNVQHNERLEFLGDAVVEFITSVHLFHMFPDIEEGGLATYRAGMVQNQTLAKLAGVLDLDKYMLYAHGADLCHDAELRHAMANCFEAVMGAIFLDGGINEADRVFGKACFGHDEKLFDAWTDLRHHPLQLQEPMGDRHWIKTFPLLKQMTGFENATGVKFTHIRLLARAFTDRSLGISNLTLGSNQRLEFLGDTVLQLVTSEFLYKHFPEHHEGHLSLLRSSMVNNRTQAVVCNDLDMPKYAAFANPRRQLKVKDRADLLEAYLGALYVDKDLEFCQKFAEVCFFPRLDQFIVNQEWNDPKSKLQQCCLTLRTMNGKEPDIPIYKVTESIGPTNTRVYGVVVYFQGKRLAKAQGHSIQEAEMNAAKLALEKCADLFPHLSFQKKIVERSFQRQNLERQKQEWQEEVQRMRKELGLDEMNERRRREREEEERRRKEEQERPMMPVQPPPPPKKAPVKAQPRDKDEPLEDGELSSEEGEGLDTLESVSSPEEIK